MCHSCCRLVAAICCTIPISWGSKGWEDGEATTQTLRDTKTEILYCKKIGFFFFLIVLGKSSCPRKIFDWSLWNWCSLLMCCYCLGVRVISYYAFCPLTGCFGEFACEFACSFLCLHDCPTSSPLFLFYFYWAIPGVTLRGGGRKEESVQKTLKCVATLHLGPRPQLQVRNTGSSHRLRTFQFRKGKGDLTTV